MKPSAELATLHVEVVKLEETIESLRYRKEKAEGLLARMKEYLESQGIEENPDSEDLEERLLWDIDDYFYS